MPYVVKYQVDWIENVGRKAQSWTVRFVLLKKINQPMERTDDMKNNIVEKMRMLFSVKRSQHALLNEKFM